jgi:hypothetical protein
MIGCAHDTRQNHLPIAPTSLHLTPFGALSYPFLCCCLCCCLQAAAWATCRRSWPACCTCTLVHVAPLLTHFLLFPMLLSAGYCLGDLQEVTARLLHLHQCATASASSEALAPSHPFSAVPCVAVCRLLPGQPAGGHGPPAAPAPVRNCLSIL